MKNKYIEIDDETIAIIINYKLKEYYCYIDKEDFSKVNEFSKTTWNLNVNRTGNIDGVRTKIQVDGVRKQYWIHNLIYIKENDDNIVDHIDHNTLNNRKSNLRELTKSENVQNQSTIKSKTATGHRNIYLEKGKYRVRVNHISFGSYKTLEEALKVAEIKRKELFPSSSEINNKITIDDYEK